MRILPIIFATCRLDHAGPRVAWADDCKEKNLLCSFQLLPRYTDVYRGAQGTELEPCLP